MKSIPKAILSGEIKLSGITLKCHALDDGRTIINEDDFHKFFKLMGEGKITEQDANHLAEELEKFKWANTNKS